MTDRQAELIELIHKEVKPALGCTEPIAVALAVAKAVDIISENCSHCGDCPLWRQTADFRIAVEVSGNILKNGMGVGIPGTGMVGLPIAAALGAVCGDPARGLEVLQGVSDSAVARAKELVKGKRVAISVADTDHLLYVKATVSMGEGIQASAEVHPRAYAVIEDDHDKIVETSFADRILMSSESGAAVKDRTTLDYGLTVREIYDFACTADYEDIKFILDDRTLNLALAKEGRILLPLSEKLRDSSSFRRQAENRSRLLSAARGGDEKAIESLTMEEMNSYDVISKRLEKEDVLTIVESCFIPYGVECDQYSLTGTITSCDLVQNRRSGEWIYQMQLDVCDFSLDVSINAERLEGEPEEGRRFRGLIWLQGEVCFPE